MRPKFSPKMIALFKERGVGREPSVWGTVGEGVGDLKHSCWVPHQPIYRLQF